MSGDPGISAFPEADNMFSWVGTINGGKNTVYEGLETSDLIFFRINGHQHMAFELFFYLIRAFWENLRRIC
ncbi:hypothetical protein SUGI_0616370 [Cryptomeria japonica]|nr:hypothetical protein SUGI_0616370 [Cryptomeria japonica]